MKTANVTEVRAVRAPANLDPAYTKPAQRERAEHLLTAYPETTAEETAEIVDFLAHGLHMDVGLVTARDEFRDKVSIIRDAHPKAFRGTLVQNFLFVLIILVPIALLGMLPRLLGRS